MSAIAPIRGKFRRAVTFDVVVGCGLGVLGGYAFWHGPHTKTNKMYENYYAKLALQQNKE
ncbi:Cytochrome c oxidase subunit 7A [Dimargaris xerosporica]|nr:Cytochrome c oxidase subunit 7A [Dimargaris xerosporica]